MNETHTRCGGRGFESPGVSDPAEGLSESMATAEHRNTRNLSTLDELSGSALDRHFARSIHKALRSYPEYAHSMVYSGRFVVYMDAVTGPHLSTIEEMGGTVANIKESGIGRVQMTIEQVD